VNTSKLLRSKSFLAYQAHRAGLAAVGADQVDGHVGVGAGVLGSPVRMDTIVCGGGRSLAPSVVVVPVPNQDPPVPGKYQLCRVDRGHSYPVTCIVRSRRRQKRRA